MAELFAATLAAPCTRHQHAGDMSVRLSCLRVTGLTNLYMTQIPEIASRHVYSEPFLNQEAV